uniref:hypothetical protein n=1 Tax=Okeania sp. SIO2F4 TaxID=2607790 RepID=UPI0025EA287F|nr:hypothetical protein [Okeania sp. SIO2F4]
MSQSEREVLEKIAQVMENLPSESLLAECWTEEQKQEWQKARNVQVYIAECWRAKFIYQQGDPIVEALEKKEIVQYKYDLIWLTVNQYKTQWELIQVAEKYVRQLQSAFTNLLSSKKISSQFYKFFPDRIFLKPYPFNSAYDLFVATLKEEIEGSFKICLEKHYDINLKTIKKGVKQLIEIIKQTDNHSGIYSELHPKKQQTLKKNMGWRRFSFSWLGTTILICQLVAIWNSSVRTKLAAFNKSSIEALNLSIKASSKLKLQAFTWIDGQKVPFDKFGGVPLKNGK